MNSRTVLVTGAARRIGAGIARALHTSGMNTAIHYHRSETAARALCDELNALRPGTALALHADLLDADAPRRLIEQAAAFGDGLDVLINNASAFYPTPVAETTAAQWEEIIGTNLTAPYFLSQAAAPRLQQNHGCIINVTDIHAVRPLRRYPVYSIAKAGLVMLTLALAKELGPDIRVNAVSPGAVLWPEDMDEALRERIIRHTTLKRQGTIEDVVSAVRYLVFDAGYMTGQVLTVDGGRTLYS
jgi:pteridine reductase